MKKKYFSQLTKFTLALLCFALLLVNMSYYHGASKGLILTFLSWSFYILCFPAAHGSYILGIPITLISKKKISTEPFMLGGAILLNAFVYIINPGIYMASFFTHLLRHLMAFPNPLWLIFTTAAITNLYRTIVKLLGKNPYSWLHSAIHLVLALINLWVFYILAYPEIILLFNFRM